MARPWFRFYRRTVNNAKVQRLRPDLFRAWVNILCATDDAGNVPEVNGLAFTLRVTEAVARKWIGQLVDARLLASDGDTVTAHDWGDHNYDSDCDATAAARQRRKRDKDRESRVSRPVTHAPRNAPSHATVTCIDRERDTEEIEIANAISKKKRATAWNDEKQILPEWLEAARQAREKRGLPGVDLELEADKFGHWAANAPPKKDWRRAWINWALNAKGVGHGHGKGFNGSAPGAGIGDTVDAILGAYERERAREIPPE